MSSEVVILDRDVVTGIIGDPLARMEVEGQITNVLFNEEFALGRLGI